MTVTAEDLGERIVSEDDAIKTSEELTELRTKVKELEEDKKALQEYAAELESNIKEYETLVDKIESQCGNKPSETPAPSLNED